MGVVDDAFTQAYFKRQLVDYEINRQGVVRSLKSGKKRNGHVLKKWVQEGKYWTHRIRIKRDDGTHYTRGIYLHLLLMYTFKPLPEGLEYCRSITVNHKDANKLNNDLDNLEWVSFDENNKHKFDIALQKATRGPVNYNVYKFRNDDGTEFTGTTRELYHNYKDKYGLFQQGLNSLVRGKNMVTGNNVGHHKKWRIVEMIQKNPDGYVTNQKIYKTLFNE